MRLLSKLWIVGVFFLPLAGFAAESDGAKILEIGGSSTVQVKRDGKEIRLKKTDVLQVGDELTTDSASSVDILLSDKTLLRIGANSVYRLEARSKVTQFLHRLFKGIVRVAVPKKLKKTNEIRFEMQTPEGTIGVRGTQFVVAVTPGETRLRGHEGTVIFGGKEMDFENPESFVLVSGGYESVIRSGEKLPSVPQPFELTKHLKEIDSSGGPFGKLAHRKHGMMKLARAKKAESQDVSLKKEEKLATPKNSIYAGKGKNMGMRRAAGGKTTLSSGMPGRKRADDPVNIAINAVRLGDLKKFILNVKAERFKPDILISEERDTLLHLSAEEGRQEIFTYLVEEHGLNVNLTNARGQTPLMAVAMYSGDAETARFLVKSGANLALRDLGKFTALDWAVGEFEKRDELVTQAKKMRSDDLPKFEKDLDRWRELVNYLIEEHKARGLPLPEELTEEAPAGDA